MGSALVTLAIIGGICVTSAAGGAVLKQAADTSSLSLLITAIAIYSVSSLGLFWLYKSGAAENFALTSYACLLGTLLAVQILSSFVLNEPMNIRAFFVLLVATAAFSWAVSSAPTSNDFPTRHGDTHEKT